VATEALCGFVGLTTGEAVNTLEAQTSSGRRLAHSPIIHLPGSRCTDVTLCCFDKQRLGFSHRHWIPIEGPGTLKASHRPVPEGLNNRALQAADGGRTRDLKLGKIETKKAETGIVVRVSAGFAS
jgi:hypothetical protein